jgi:hypothetical protein
LLRGLRTLFPKELQILPGHIADQLAEDLFASVRELPAAAPGSPPGGRNIMENHGGVMQMDKR